MELKLKITPDQFNSIFAIKQPITMSNETPCSESIPLFESLVDKQPVNEPADLVEKSSLMDRGAALASQEQVKENPSQKKYKLNPNATYMSSHAQPFIFLNPHTQSFFPPLNPYAQSFFPRLKSNAMEFIPAARHEKFKQEVIDTESVIHLKF